MPDYNLTDNAVDIDSYLQAVGEAKAASSIDTTIDRLLKFKDFGIGGPIQVPNNNVDDAKDAGFYFGYEGANINVSSGDNPFPTGGGAFALSVVGEAISPGFIQQTAYKYNATTSFVDVRFRSSAGTGFTDWVDFIHTSNASSLPITTSFAPGTDNTYSNGAASQRWSIIYAGTGSINTSDGREKDNYRSLTDSEIACAKELSNNIGVYQWLSSLEEKGDDARLHVGMYVQHAISVFESFGLDPMRYGFICYDEWGAKTDEDGNVTQEAGNRYGFRYDQLNQFLIAGLNARIATLEGK